MQFSKVVSSKRILPVGEAEVLSETYNTDCFANRTRPNLETYQLRKTTSEQYLTSVGILLAVPVLSFLKRQQVDTESILMRPMCDRMGLLVQLLHVWFNLLVGEDRRRYVISPYSSWVHPPLPDEPLTVISPAQVTILELDFSPFWLKMEKGKWNSAPSVSWLFVVRHRHTKISKFCF